MAKHDFRLSNDEESRFQEMMTACQFHSKSSFIRFLLKEGMLAVINDAPLQKFERDQTVGWELTKVPPPSDKQAYQDLEGYYHIPFKLLQKPHGPSLRDLIKIRDGNKCRKCGSVESAQLYRIDGDQTNNTLENLITLCRACIKASQKFMLMKERRKLFAIWFYLGQDENI